MYENHLNDTNSDVGLIDPSINPVVIKIKKQSTAPSALIINSRNGS